MRLVRPSVRTLLALAVVATLTGVPAPAHAVCGKKAWTQGYPLWTHEEPLQVRGEFVPPVVQSPWPGWADVPTGQYVWKSPGGNHPLTATPVVFTSETFAGCGPTVYQGTLKINADDIYTAYLNGVLVAHCEISCFSTFATVQVTINNVANTLVVLVWNTSFGPAMLQYELSY